MKNTNLLPRAASRKNFFAALLLLGASAFTQVHAQPSIVMPTINDFFMTNFGSDGYPNSANIDYSPFCAGSACAGTNKRHRPLLPTMVLILHFMSMTRLSLFLFPGQV